MQEKLTELSIVLFIFGCMIDMSGMVNGVVGVKVFH